MTELYTQPYVIPAAPVGPENPLPVFRGAEDDSEFPLTDRVPAEDRTHMGWRTAFRVLPYRMQDGYTRDKRPTVFESVVLENDWLRATVLPALGGKLVSLVHKPSFRELFHHNPVVQPANLALRNAWTSGGVEWNAGQLGHHYFTCSPVFAAQVEGPAGVPVLRLYEWERVKGFTWQVDLHLPDASPFLFARVRLVNPHDHEIPMYWWTNIAVDEAPDLRVIAPAESVLHNAPDAIDLSPLPLVAGEDITYSVNNRRSCEYFFRIPDGCRRWVAGLDGAGRGLVHTSTDRLRGRKMFCWGTLPGSRRWQEFLAGRGHAYVELQGGLARTQLESLPMPARTEWAWTEAFGLLEADPGAVHGGDWVQARTAAAQALDAALPREAVERVHEELGAVAQRRPDLLLARGSGWGALERLRQGQPGDDPLVPGLSFDAPSLGEDQAPWLCLLGTGTFPERAPEAGPGQFMIQAPWRTMLEDAAAAGRVDHWLGWYHLGVMAFERRELTEARNLFLRSLRACPTGWALHCLAAVDEREGNTEAACERLLEAWRVGPLSGALADACATALLGAGQWDALEAFLRALPKSTRDRERIGIVSARLALQRGDFASVSALFEREFVYMGEGEGTLADLWLAYQEKRLGAKSPVQTQAAAPRDVRHSLAVPFRLDFRVGE